MGEEKRCSRTQKVGDGYLFTFPTPNPKSRISDILPPVLPLLFAV